MLLYECSLYVFSLYVSRLKNTLKWRRQEKKRGTKAVLSIARSYAKVRVGRFFGSWKLLGTTIRVANENNTTAVDAKMSCSRKISVLIIEWTWTIQYIRKQQLLQKKTITLHLSCSFIKWRTINCWFIHPR